MTFLAPILVALFYAGAIYFAVNGGDDNAQKDIYFEAEYWEANPSDLNFVGHSKSLPSTVICAEPEEI